MNPIGTTTWTLWGEDRPGTAWWTYAERPSVTCCDCSLVFSDAVAPLHAARLRHRMGTPSLLPSGEVAA